MKDDTVLVKQGKNNTYIVEYVGRTYAPYGTLIEVLGTVKIKAKWDKDRYKAYMTFQKGNFEDVLTVLRATHDTVIVESWHNTTEKCNASCQNAKGHICTCSCLHKQHGKPDARYKSVQALSDVLIKSEWVKVSVTYTKPAEGHTTLHKDYAKLVEENRV